MVRQLALPAMARENQAVAPLFNFSEESAPMSLNTFARVSLVLLSIVAGACVHAQDAPTGDAADLSDFPFWRQMSGTWESENTYFDSDMDYQVRAYNSLVRIELAGRQFRETEHRFYPAGLGPSRYGKGIEKPGEGIELVVKTTGELIDGAGTLGNIWTDHSVGSSDPNVVYRILSRNDGVRVKTNTDTGVDNYRMYFNFITPDSRLRSNVGIHSAAEDNLGHLRAFILYRDLRVDPTVFEARRAALRKRHNVRVISVANPDGSGRSLVTRLE
jgi:hypothetical protein